MFHVKQVNASTGGGLGELYLVLHSQRTDGLGIAAL